MPPRLRRARPAYRVRVSSLPTGGQIVVAFPLSPLTSTLHFLAWVELAVAGLALAAVAALGWWLVRLSLRPLAEMEQTAAAITEGELSRRIPGDRAPTEVGRLARTLNTMLGRIQDAFAARDATEAELRQSEERLRRFVADASHELRTPLAAVGAYAELFDRGADERPQDLARVMSGIRAETARMGELVEDLLLLARLDEGRPLEHQAVELVGLAAEAARAAVAVGPGMAGAAGCHRGGRGHGRQRPAPPGPRQPAVQRPGSHPARDLYPGSSHQPRELRRHRSGRQRARAAR